LAVPRSMAKSWEKIPDIECKSMVIPFFLGGVMLLR